ncbi:MAG: hypothetical protein MZV63_65475 [Marinilabiliales bacterium]|nr:hypothetical protein [Marinilabiliales bacterium]
MMMKQMFYAWLVRRGLHPVRPDGLLPAGHPPPARSGRSSCSSSSPWSGRPTRACGSTRPSRSTPS